MSHASKKFMRELRINVIRFSIGMILLIISFFYLQNNPAEKAAIVAGFSILRQKVVTISYSLTGHDTQGLQAKEEMIKNYKELLHVIAENDCLTGSQRQQFDTIYTTLDNEKASNFLDKKTEYLRSANEFFALIDRTCPRAEQQTTQTLQPAT